jgi:ABC-type polar amino acid transport system ATPase subunit
VTTPEHSHADGAGAALLEYIDVHKSFGDNEVLRGVELAVQPRDVVVLIGPSGSGKSTLLRCGNGLETIDGGDVIFGGRSVPGAGRDVAKLRAEIGFVFQQFNLFPHLSVLRNITLGPTEVKGVSKAGADKRARELLARVGIPEKADAYPAELSGGQQQRVAIARALAMDPKLMMFDEPTSALDPEMIAEVLEVMADLARDGMTMLVVSHEMGFARAAANRIAFMDAGRIVEEAPPDRFFREAVNPRTKAFLARILTHDGTDSGEPNGRD